MAGAGVKSQPRPTAGADRHEACPAARAGRRDPEWRQRRIGETTPGQGHAHPFDLPVAVGGGSEVLQRAAATVAEMWTDGLGASRPRRQDGDQRRARAAATASRRRDQHAVAGHGKGYEHARALVVGDAVATSADFLDGQFELTR